MFRWKISAETFAIETGDRAKAWGLREIERISNRNDRSSNLELLRAGDRQRRAGQIHFQHGDAAADIGQQLPRGIFSSFELNRHVLGFATDRISSVKRAGWIDKEPSAGKFAVLIGRLDFDYRFGAVLENIFDFATDSGRRFRSGLRGKRSRRGEKREFCQQAKPLA